MLAERKPNVDRGSRSLPFALRAPGVIEVFVANSNLIVMLLREERRMADG
jgi:hypothetical protein